MGKWAKMTFLALLLAGTGYFFGIVCKQIGQTYELMLSRSGELLGLLFGFLLALGAVAAAAGLIAALLRPVGVGVLAFALFGLTTLSGWQLTLGSGILVLVCVLAASLYAREVSMELSQRIRFSVRPISESQGTLLMALILVACGSVYLGCSSHIEREGFSIPESYIQTLMDQMEEQVKARTPEEELQEVVADFREEFRQTIDDFSERILEPNERFIPLAVAASVFMPLVTITRLLAWVPTVVLRVVFPLLEALGITEVVSETQEVQRLVIS